MCVRTTFKTIRYWKCIILELKFGKIEAYGVKFKYFKKYENFPPLVQSIQEAPSIFTNPISDF